MTPAPDPASFRDPEGSVFHSQGRVFRCLKGNGRASLQAASDAGLLQELHRLGLAVETHPCSEKEAAALGMSSPGDFVVEHEKIPYISYPYEWSFEMLREAARVHLRIMEHLVPKGFILKDSTAYNYQFVGARACLIDIPSIEPRRPKEPWVGYTQFCRHFLNPLLVQSLLKVSLHPMLRGQLEGIPVEDAHALLPFWKQFRAGAWVHVCLQAILSRGGSRASSEKSLFEALPDQGEVIASNVRKLLRLVERLPNPRHQSVWTDYEKTQSYSQTGREWKRKLAGDLAARVRPGLVYDLGANTGEYSLLAAPHAAQVVAFDSDISAIDRLYLRLGQKGPANVLPLVMDLTNPSPDQGFAGRERGSMNRRGAPDLIFAFALVHHLRITGNIPVRAFLEWFASFGARHLLVEFVPKEDPMVQELLKNRKDVYDDYHVEHFAQVCRELFRVESRNRVPDSAREVFLLEKRAAG